MHVLNCFLPIFSVISVPSVVNVFGCGSAALCSLWLDFEMEEGRKDELVGNG